ncbi:uracil-DNA glycosylase [Aliifodinibius salicampi]|uniref:Type-4 uracil-DNA glycosylase n=1 Tax=Fodinibius salicampi TaxID=1920655 RepID=A0ABT3PW72_9BACT|nr:uracil-DNA glycosylase [Fodinibius salicampi]MCW9712107.1 uracil-DNA glycosylase [Fodinibius salicampi]
MANSKSKQIIEEVLHFLETERSLYGDFEVSQNDSDAKEQEKEAKANSFSNETDINITSEPSPDTNAPAQKKAKDSSKSIYEQIDQCSTLKELEDLCRKANVLKTDLDDTQLVFGVGNPDADLMLIGEAPGAEEDRLGEPFVGKAGQLLNKILHAIDFDREEVYIANILKHRPPNNRNPKPEERKRSLPFLLKQIDLINPKLILALGKVSAQTLLGNDQSLTKMRGKFHSFGDKYQLMATYHPAALLRHKKWKRPTWEDVQRLRKKYDELNGEP